MKGKLPFALSISFLFPFCFFFFLFIFLIFLPFFSLFFFLSVFVLWSRQDYEGALSWMEEALKLNSTSVHYLKGLGSTALAANEPLRAMQCMEAALEIILRIPANTWRVTLHSAAPVRCASNG
jgi:hypothetical protein